MNVNRTGTELTLEDYTDHKSFIRLIDEGHFYVVEMYSDITIDGTFKALDEMVVEFDRYRRIFFKKDIK